jgi:hypothetical protein
MADSVQVTCLRKRASHYNPHARIERLGGMHGGKRWSLPEEDIISELKKPISTRRWNFYVNINGKNVRVILATHGGRDYLNTEVDGYEPNNLLSLPECPSTSF